MMVTADTQRGAGITATATAASSSSHGAEPPIEVAVFWDYENTPLPREVRPAEAAKAVQSAAESLPSVRGRPCRINMQRVYFDPYKVRGVKPRNPAELDSSGFDLVQTPSRNTKETADKKLIVDLLIFVWEVRERGGEPLVVLITSDGDYSYTLARLKQRGVMNAVLYGRDESTATILKDNAQDSLSFEKDVLGSFPSSSSGENGTAREHGASAGAGSGAANGPAAASASAPAATNAAAASACAPPKQQRASHSRRSSAVSDAHTSRSNLGLCVHAATNAAAALASAPKKQQKQQHVSHSRRSSAVSDVRTSRNVRALCVCLGIKQKTWGAHRRVSHEMCWVPNDIVDRSFRPSDIVEVPDMFSAVKNDAIEGGYVEPALKDRGVYAPIGLDDSTTYLSDEYYLRLTSAGQKCVAEIQDAEVQALCLSLGEWIERFRIPPDRYWMSFRILDKAYDPSYPLADEKGLASQKKNTREGAESSKYIKIARKVMGDKGEFVPKPMWRSFAGGKLSDDIYFQLTLAGTQLVERTSTIKTRRSDLRGEGNFLKVTDDGFYYA